MCLRLRVVRAVQRLDAFFEAGRSFFTSFESARCSSRSCFGSTGDGASGHQVHGRGGLRERDDLADRALARPGCATMRSRPSAMPPCGGVPYSSASRKKPKRSFASSSLMLSSEKIRPAAPRREYGCCRRRSRCRSAPGRTPWRGRCPGSVSSSAEVLVVRRRERVVHRRPSASPPASHSSSGKVDHPEERELRPG